MSQEDHSTTHAVTNDNERETRGLCLLSLDGGGVRGLSTLLLLSALMQRLNDERRLLKLKPVKPCEVFDLIGGTSTGGLVAIMLGRLEMDVDACIKAYKALMMTVFEKKKNVVTLSLRGMIKARFDSEILESSIKSVIQNCRSPDKEAIPVDEPFCRENQDEDEKRCRVFVCAQRKETGKIARLRSYRGIGDIPETATIWQAALATSAATSFFDPVKIGDCTYVDGALGANNPARQVEAEADHIWCEKTGKVEPLVKCFVSLGTGEGGINPVTDRAWKFLTKTLTAVATDTGMTAQDVANRWRDSQNTRYFRFNVDHGLQNIGLEEYKQIGLMEAATRDYLDDARTQPMVRSCVTNLRTKKYIPTPEFCRKQTELQTASDEKKCSEPAPMTPEEIPELMTQANTYLKLSRERITPSDLLKAHSIFTSILRFKRTQQQPPAPPKELAYLYDKLRATCLRLSHPVNFPAARRMTYIDDAVRFGDRAVEYAIQTRNGERVAQMQFHAACVQARKIQLQGSEGQFESATPDKRNEVVDAIEMAYATLRSIEGSDVVRYTAIREECLGQIGG